MWPLCSATIGNPESLQSHNVDHVGQVFPPVLNIMILVIQEGSVAALVGICGVCEPQPPSERPFGPHPGAYILSTHRQAHNLFHEGLWVQ